MALEAVLAAARTRLATAERDARKAEATDTPYVIQAKWQAVAAVRREVKELTQQAQQQPVVHTAPAAYAVPDQNSIRPPKQAAATLPDPRAFAEMLVKTIDARVAPLRAEVAELRAELAKAQSGQRVRGAKLRAVPTRPRSAA